MGNSLDSKKDQDLTTSKKDEIAVLWETMVWEEVLTRSTETREPLEQILQSIKEQEAELKKLIQQEFVNIAGKLGGKEEEDGFVFSTTGPFLENIGENSKSMVDGFSKHLQKAIEMDAPPVRFSGSEVDRMVSTVKENVGFLLWNLKRARFSDRTRD